MARNAFGASPLTAKIRRASSNPSRYAASASSGRPHSRAMSPTLFNDTIMSRSAPGASSLPARIRRASSNPSL